MRCHALLRPIRPPKLSRKSEILRLLRARILALDISVELRPSRNARDLRTREPDDHLVAVVELETEDSVSLVARFAGRSLMNSSTGSTPLLSRW
jgi:hypothetical protein